MAKKNFYVVTAGRIPGIYPAWEHADPSKSAKAQVDKFPGAIFKGHGTLEDAQKAFGDVTPAQVAQPVQQVVQQAPSQDDSISIDAACSGNPGPMEYRGVWTKTGEVIFQSPVYTGTNNIGEFLALVSAIAYAQRKGLTCDIHTDSKTAMAWVRNKKTKTTFDFNKDPVLWNEVQKAIRYLQQNEQYPHIKKWDTATQGEIKADYGRK